METFFMNTKNSKTSEPYRFKCDLIDKLDLRNPNKMMTLPGKMLNQSIKTISLKYQHPHGAKSLTCLMDCIIYQKCKITSNI